jgi:hypothetical protein
LSEVYEAKISRNIKTPIVNSETLSSALSSQILSQQDRETICKLNKMIQVSKHVEANDPKSIEIGGKEYNIKSVFSELNPPVFELEEVSQECELSRRFYKLDELNLDALYDGEYYSEIIPIDDTLHLRNPYTNKKTTIPLENIENDSLKTSRKDLVFLAGDGKEYAIVKIAPDTMAVLLETKKEKLYLPLDKMPNNFECLLKGKLGHGAYEISNSSTGLTAKHPSSHSWQPISNDDIEPTLTNYHHTELGKITTSTLKLYMDKADARHLPSQMPLEDKIIGSLTSGKLSMAMDVQDERSKLDFLYTLSPKKDAFFNTIGLNPDSSSLLNSWLKLRKDSNATTYISTYLARKNQDRENRFKFLKDNNITVKTPYNPIGKENFIYPHSKILAGEDLSGTPRVRLDTSGFIIYPGFMKLDIGLELDTRQSKLVHDYFKEANCFNFDITQARKKLDDLAKEGIMINDPKSKKYFATRGMHQLIREAKESIVCNYGDCNDEIFIDEILKKHKSGVDIKLIFHEIRENALKLIYDNFSDRLDLTFDEFLRDVRNPNKSYYFKTHGFSLLRQERFKNNSEKSPFYIHSNILSCDNKKVMVGTNFPWVNAVYNRVLPDGPSHESAFIASGDLAKTILHKLKGFESALYDSTLNNVPRNIIAERLQHLVF